MEQLSNIELKKREEEYRLELKSIKVRRFWFVLNFLMFVYITIILSLFMSFFLDKFMGRSLSIVDQAINNALKVMCYIVPAITSIILAGINGFLLNSLINNEAFKEIMIKKDDFSVLNDILILYPQPSTINRLLLVLIEEYMEKISISESGREHIREFLTAYHELGDDQDTPIYILDENKSSLVNINSEKLKRYHFFRMMIGDNGWTSDNSLVVLDGYSIDDYLLLFDFISESSMDKLYCIGLNVSKLRKLYELAEIYNIKDCMVYCYILKPNQFILEVSNGV